MRTTVTATLLFEAVHCWPACPIESVKFLRDPHRHVFHITCEAQVGHADRDIEFIRLRSEIEDYLRAKYPGPIPDLGAMSCEMIALDLVHVFGLVKCSVFEDGENGATVYADEPRPTSLSYTDPSACSRKAWVGKEVEGRLKGLTTLFLTELSDPDSISHAHVFLCPTVAQASEPDKLETFVSELARKGIVVTVAVKPKDAARLTPFVRVQAHIMVDIDLHGLGWLKPTDTIKVEVASYTTYSATVEQMIATNPQDYQSDETLYPLPTT